MNPTPEESVSYQDALFALNDLCGKRVHARIADADDVYMTAVGILRHSQDEGMWGQYYVGDDALFDVTGFQPYERHHACESAVGFYGGGLRAEVVLRPEGGVSWRS
jgi:hypothetical protein